MRTLQLNNVKTCLFKVLKMTAKRKALQSILENLNLI